MADLQGTFDFLGLNGHLLSPAEQTALSCSLLQLSNEAGRMVRLWGKIIGYDGDYLVAQAVPVAGSVAVQLESLGDRRTWYSVDGGHNWTELEKAGPVYKLPKGERLPKGLDDEAVLREQRVAYCEQIRGHFWGRPDFEYKVREVMPEPEPEVAPPPPPKPDGDEDKEEDDEGDDGDADDKDDEGEEAAADEGAGEGGEPEEGDAAAPKKRKQKFMLVCTKESTRLAYFVEQHDRHCQVAPYGQYMVTAADPATPLSVAINKTWDGLSPAEADDLRSYLHFRPPLGERPVRTQGRPHNAALDFMEPISNDIPSGVWSLQYDPSLGVAVGKNMLYQGSVFYHKPQSALFGQYYFGYGQRNLDLCFMLPEEHGYRKM
eukprot:TRINITY_DN36442_c0_g1_i1.p1 TRINITY_DN36442_c0_g1~~TRINITY_DN36442_c0_g1_i1.p1  ORF type:complete len:375 (+),score=161.23 TRINITY_DN36442_c0_g1_i1:64-1188(+)